MRYKSESALLKRRRVLWARVGGLVHLPKHHNLGHRLDLGKQRVGELVCRDCLEAFSVWQQKHKCAFAGRQQEALALLLVFFLFRVLGLSDCDALPGVAEVDAREGLRGDARAENQCEGNACRLLVSEELGTLLGESERCGLLLLLFLHVFFVALVLRVRGIVPLWL